VLTIYTYDSFASEWGTASKVSEPFEKICHCKLRWVTFGDGAEILTRLQLEGAKSPADLALGLDTSLLARAQETKLFSPHTPQTPAISPDYLPIAWEDKTFIPYDWGYFAFVYNTQMLKNPPASLWELANTSKAKIIIQDPRISTPGLGLLLWIKKAFGDKSGEVWSKLAHRIVTVTQGWSESYALFLAGESDMVLSYTTSPAYHLITEDDDRFKAALFSEGHYLQIEVAAKLSHAKHPNLADQFLDFMLSAEFQREIPTTNWMYPAILYSPLPAKFPKPIEDKDTLFFTSKESLLVKRKALDEWLRTLTH
jgi:thiamine transport system substrate-binding protein